MVSLAETPLTGKPDAGNPPVRFGGRGSSKAALPTPIFGCGFAALCCIAEFRSASRWETPARGTDPTLCRIQFGDTAQRGQAATKVASFQSAFRCWLRLGRAALYVSGRLLRSGRIHGWERGLRVVELCLCKNHFCPKTSFPKALWTSSAR